jgi:nitroreductase
MVEPWHTVVTFILGFVLGWFVNSRSTNSTKQPLTRNDSSQSKPLGVNPDDSSQLLSKRQPKPLPLPTEIANLIANRRSMYPKDMNGGEVPVEVINSMLECANWAPTHGKTEPWRFAVFNREAIEQLQIIKAEEMKRSLKNKPPHVLEQIMQKAARKEKEMSNVSHLIAICMKRVPRENGEFMPEWEEIASVACAVQNMHLYLSANKPYCGYWSSGGTEGWLNSFEMRRLLELTEEGDRCLGLFYVGVSPKVDKMRSSRGPIAEKVKLFNGPLDFLGDPPEGMPELPELPELHASEVQIIDDLPGIARENRSA